MAYVPSPYTLIKRKCLECSGGNAKEVEACPIKTCPIYVYRKGPIPEKEIKKDKPNGKARQSSKGIKRKPTTARQNAIRVVS